MFESLNIAIELNSIAQPVLNLLIQSSIGAVCCDTHIIGNACGAFYNAVIRFF